MSAQPPGRAVRVRRLLVGTGMTVASALCLWAATGTPATAEGTADVAAYYEAAETRCAVPEVPDPDGSSESALAELSGLLDTGDGRLIALNDGGSTVRLFVLGLDCSPVQVIEPDPQPGFAELDPYDPEDLAAGPDGTVWIADAGDNDETRADILLARLTPPAGAEDNWQYDYLHLTYPDGPRNSEALFVAPDGTPYVVTKDLVGRSEVFRAAAPGSADTTAVLEPVGEIALSPTGTGGGPVGRIGEVLITGAAMSRDGAYLAVRTYTDAYLWPVPTSSDGRADLTAALDVQPTLVVGLPDSPQGEAITFAGDDRSLLLASEGVGSDITLLPATAGLLDGTVGTGADDVDPSTESDADVDRTDSGDPSVSGVEPVTAAVLIGVVAAAVGVIVVLVNRSRRRR